MHEAHSSNSCVGLPAGTVLVLAATSPPRLLPKLATWGALVPEQAVNPMAAAAARTATPSHRRYRVICHFLVRGLTQPLAPRVGVAVAPPLPPGPGGGPLPG